MEILINGRCMEGKQMGVGRYLSNLLTVWTEKYTQHKYKLFFKSEIPTDTCLTNECVTSSIAAGENLIHYGPVWENIFLPLAARQCKDADIFFSSAYTLPLIPLRCKSAITIFDISYLTHPEWYSYKYRIPYQILTKPTLKKADIILTGSEFTKQEILKLYDLNQDKIIVTNLGLEKRFIELENELCDVDYVKAKYNLTGKIILSVGTIYNRRNIPVLIESLANVIKRNGEDITLVIIGKNYTLPNIDIMQVANRFNVEQNICWITYTTDDELYALYKVADLFVCSSTYEGFNIPPLEAMSLGVPVICSVLSSLPEVVGDAAYPLEDPTDPQEMTVALEKVLTDDKLKIALIEKGTQRSKIFSWEKCAEQTIECFQKMVQC